MNLLRLRLSLLVGIRVSALAAGAAAGIVLAGAPPAHGQSAPDAVLTRAAQHHVECARPAFRADRVEVVLHPGYGIEVRGEPYWVALEGRSRFALLLPGSDEAVAQVTIDRPPAEEFEEQARWRLRWLEGVAVRSGVEPVRQALPEGAALLTINKKALVGRAAGISMLTDPRRRLFVQWDWTILPRYAGVQDAAAMQAAVRQRLLPCVLGA